MVDRAIDRLEGVFGQHAVVAELLELEQAAIGGKADVAQLRQVGEAPADAEVIAVVDRGLGSERAAFLVVLLDPRALVVDVQRGRDAVGQDAGAEAAGRAAVDPAAEDQLHLVGTAEIEVLADHLLEEQPAVGSADRAPG